MGETNEANTHKCIEKTFVYNWWFHLKKLGLVDDGSACVVGS